MGDFFDELNTRSDLIKETLSTEENKFRETLSKGLEILGQELPNIKDNTLGLDFINKLKTRNFKKKAPSEYPEEFIQHDPNETERKNPDRIHYGFVAQEVKEAMDSVGHSEFPVWKENRDGMQELGEAELITPLVKAVQELTEIVKSQQKEIEELKNK